MEPPIFQALFRLAVESLPTGEVLLDPDGKIVLVNSHVERQFGYTAGEVVGKAASLLLPDAASGTPGRHDAYDEKTEGLSNAPAARLSSGRHRNGREFPVALSLNPIATNSGVYTLVSISGAAVRSDAQEAATQALEHRLAFERLITQLSFQFINLPSDQVVGAIPDALSKIGEASGVDRCSFFRIRGSHTPIIPIGSWHRPGVVPFPVVDSPKESLPGWFESALAGEIVCFSKIDEVTNPTDRAAYERIGIRSCVTLPLSVSGQVVAALTFAMVRSERSWTPETIQSLRLVAMIFGSILSRADNDEAVRETMVEAERVRDQLRAEKSYLRREVRERFGGGRIVGQSPALSRVLEQVRQVASTDATVLLLGETGTGKELLATHLHELSERHARTMVRVNCSAIPATLIESELFGREKGAFTGALAKQIGRFELADGSTIFLDEIGDLPPEVQVKLLRVLEERQVERLGSPKSIHIDVRVVAATHRNLEDLIAKGTFREDLFYRLNVFPIKVPALRERSDDIPLLIWRFVAEFAKAFGKRIDRIPPENMSALQRYPWPGNVRELRNVVERAMIVTTGPELTIALPAHSGRAIARSLRLSDVEAEHIRGVLESTGWRIRGSAGAADALGLRPTTLETRMAKLGLRRPKRL